MLFLISNLVKAHNYLNFYNIYVNRQMESVSEFFVLQLMLFVLFAYTIQSLGFSLGIDFQFQKILRHKIAGMPTKPTNQIILVA